MDNTALLKKVESMEAALEKLTGRYILAMVRLR